MLGAGPGLVGSTSRSSLPMELLRAIGRVPQGKMDVDLTEEQHQQQRRLNNQSDDSAAPPPPRTILLHIDETDKALHKFMTLLLNFIEDGELTASNSDIKFVLPRETRLLVVLTANYGATVIREMCPLSQYAEARQAIEMAMEDHGVARAVLGRLPYVLPYFALEPETERRISDAIVCSALSDTEHPYRAQFGRVTWPPASEVIDVIKRNYGLVSGGDLGMRGLETGLEAFKTEFYYGVASALLRQAPAPAISAATEEEEEESSEEEDDDDDNDDDDIISLTVLDATPRRITRSLSAVLKPPKQQRRAQIISKALKAQKPPQAPQAPQPHLTYRRFAYPSEELQALRAASPSAFSRSACNQLEQQLQQQLDIGLLMVHCQARLVLCLVDRAAVAPRIGGGTKSLKLLRPSPPFTLLRRRLLLVGRRQLAVRCASCQGTHAKNEPCDDLLSSSAEQQDDGEYEAGAEYATVTTTTNNNTTDRMEISLAAIRQLLVKQQQQQKHVYRPLMLTSGAATAPTKK